MELPKLYQKSNKTGEIKVYQLCVMENDDDSATMTIQFGQKGKHMQTVKKEFSKTQKKGKTVSAPIDEAIKAAFEMFNAKKKQGYADTESIAEDLAKDRKESSDEEDKDVNPMDVDKEDKVKDEKKAKDENKNNDEEDDASDEDEEEGDKPKEKKAVNYKVYLPMLAYDYKKKSNCLNFPCYCQAKLDGVRAVANTTRLTSRNGNAFPTLNHIKDELEKIKENIILDGELYTDDVNFEKIVSLVKKGKKSPEEEIESFKIYYNVFDCISNGTFEERYEKLKKLFASYTFNYIKLVECDELKTKADLEPKLDYYIKEGYEGIILRNKKGVYEENKRSTELQKLKRFVDAEFEIVGKMTPTTGKEEGCVIWVCQTKDGKEFNCRPEGTYTERKKLYKEGKKHIGKMLTVRYQELTRDGIPRFPVGISIRDYE